MGLDRSSWLLSLYLLLGVLLPAGCVLWFMNQAASSQEAAARQSVTEAYRNQLAFLRDRVDEFWQRRIAELESGPASAEEFARVVREGLADSVVFTSYPAPLPPLRATPGPPAQTMVRALVRDGNKEAAIQTIHGQFITGPQAHARDSQGRLMAADEQLLELKLLARSDARFAPALLRLIQQLNDYQQVSMPSAQRLFLMDEIKAIDPQAEFPTIEAERLAQQYLEGKVVPPGVLKIESKTRRNIALFRSGTILAASRPVLDQHSSSVRFTLLPPGAAGPGESLEAGPMLPGWRISFAILDTKAVEQAARARRVSYLWAGFLAASVIAAIGLLLGSVFRRQMRLARLKTDLVAAVSHELKTPLASMRVLVDSLLDDPELDPVKTRDYLQLIAGENLRLTRLIENFLTFSRIERNRQRFEFATLNAAEPIQEAASIARERWQSSGCELTIDAAADLPLPRADQDALVTALLNLLDNAYKYTLGEKQIALRARLAGDQVVIEVTDNGIGISPRDQKRIFRRFYRVDQRLARETQGCGLGLSIVDYIVRAHGGSVSVRSNLGDGSTFTVRLPAKAEVREAAA